MCARVHAYVHVVEVGDELFEIHLKEIFPSNTKPIYLNLLPVPFHWPFPPKTSN